MSMEEPGKHVGWLEIYVSIMARARAFYTTVSGRELTSLPETGEGGEMYAFSWVEGATGAAGALVLHPMCDPGKGGSLVYFSCEDVADDASRAVEAGGRIIRSKMTIRQRAYCTDRG